MLRAFRAQHALLLIAFGNAAIACDATEESSGGGDGGATGEKGTQTTASTADTTATTVASTTDTTSSSSTGPATPLPPCAPASTFDSADELFADWVEFFPNFTFSMGSARLDPNFTVDGDLWALAYRADNLPFKNCFASIQVSESTEPFLGVQGMEWRVGAQSLGGTTSVVRVVAGVAEREAVDAFPTAIGIAEHDGELYLGYKLGGAWHMSNAGATPWPVDTTHGFGVIGGAPAFFDNYNADAMTTADLP